MYKLQSEPDKSIKLESGAVCKPVATLKDEHGGISHIIVDDHCFVLVNKSIANEGFFCPVKHWYKEAAIAMKSLPVILLSIQLEANND